MPKRKHKQDTAPSTRKSSRSKSTKAEDDAKPPGVVEAESEDGAGDEGEVQVELPPDVEYLSKVGGRVRPLTR